MQSNNITQAFIFAAGRGERMRPITDSIPKPLVKILGKEIISYSLKKVNQIKTINKIIINGFYLSEQIIEFIQKQNNKKIIFSCEKEKIETGGGLVFAKNKINLNEPLLIINGDILWQENNILQINKLWQKWLEITTENKDCEILLGLKPKDQYYGYEGDGDFVLSKDHKINCKKDNKSHVYIGLAIINPKILERKPNEKCFSLNYFFKEKITNNGDIENIRGIELDAEFFHIRDVKSIKNSEDILLKLLHNENSPISA